MPSSQHTAFRAPPDPDVPIWRYLDFTKFVSLLETGALYFPRSDLLGDPLEGSLSEPSIAERNSRFRDLLSHGAEAAIEHSTNSRNAFRGSMFINCWHVSEFESAAMWDIYGRSGHGIAIRSTYDKLHRVLDTQTYLGLVEYIDFSGQRIPEGNYFYPFLHKRRSFAFEAELRAITFDPPTPEGFSDPTAEPTKIGIYQTVDLDELIGSIHVAPRGQDWFRDLVEQLCKRYNLQKPVNRSALDASPLF